MMCRCKKEKVGTSSYSSFFSFFPTSLRERKEMMTNALKYLLGFCLLGQPAASEYGVDCSFPIHNKDLTCGSYLGDRASIYEEFMLGCREKYGAICQSNDYRRIVTALRQPEMVAVRRLNVLQLQSQVCRIS